MRHLALPVRDQERSRRFYETYFGFDIESPEAVRAFRDRLRADGVPIVEEWEEPEYVSVKCRDPDGYVVEAAWEPSRGGAEAERLHAALCAAFERLAGAVDGARFERRDGYALVRFPRLPFPQFNGVWASGGEEDAAGRALERLAAEIEAD